MTNSTQQQAAESRAAYIADLVSQAPRFTESQRASIAVILQPASDAYHSKRGPSEAELQRRKEAEERATALAALRKEAQALTACHGCGLQPEEHGYQKAYGMGYHDWEPIRG